MDGNLFTPLNFNVVDLLSALTDPKSTATLELGTPFDCPRANCPIVVRHYPWWGLSLAGDESLGDLAMVSRCLSLRGALCGGIDLRCFLGYH